MCTTNLSDVPVEIWEDKTVRFCEGYAGIKITNGKLICNTRLRRQLLKKASCVPHCYAGFIFPLKRYWYLTPYHHHHHHPKHAHTHSCSPADYFMFVVSLFSLLQSERQPVPPMGATITVLWLTTGPSVTVTAATRSLPMERCAKVSVGFIADLFTSRQFKLHVAVYPDFLFADCIVRVGGCMQRRLEFHQITCLKVED